MPLPPLHFAGLREAYAAGRTRPTEIVTAIFDAIAARGADGVWISLAEREAVLRRAAELERQGPNALPLWGIPFAVKDNIDVAGLPTTAACPAFAYRPEKTAFVVERLLKAGALLIGKTNLDQFATGLVGVRSPYGVARNPFDAAYIPGGSSSGSAVAVSAGLVSFSLGTDTAGSGRVPAGFNNIVGLKPSVGLLSATGMVPACRALDCISIFALTVSDACDALGIAAEYDDADGYSRAAPPGWRAAPLPAPARFRFGLPRRDQLQFFGDAASAALFDQGVAALQKMGGEAVEIDYAPFAEAAQQLYLPAGTAERTAALEAFMVDYADEMHPVTRQIVERGREARGVDVHRLYYRLRDLRQQTAAMWDEIDCMVVPTSGTIYRVAEVEADPVRLNGNLGHYTNFVNYFDLSALAVPNGFLPNGLPAGLTLIGPAFAEAALAAIGQSFHAARGLTLGATDQPLPPPAVAAPGCHPMVPLAVFGAHMSGEPLNGQLRGLGARFVSACETAPDYKLYALAGKVARPGLVRVEAGRGAAIEGEIWNLPTAAFGAFVAEIPGPLGIGDVRLADGSMVKGFLCEAAGAASAPEITGFGGWRGFRRQQAS